MGKAVAKPWNFWRQLIVPFTGAGVTAGMLDYRIGAYAAKLAAVT